MSRGDPSRAAREPGDGPGALRPADPARGAGPSLGPGRYQDYLAAAEAYINCLGREHESIFDEMGAVLRRWREYFGDEARMRLVAVPP